jgi:hypothetical protein
MTKYHTITFATTLIAQAKQRKAIVVTHEVPSNSLKKINGFDFKF